MHSRSSDSSRIHASRSVVPATALGALLLSGCLGGDGKSQPDAAPGAPDAQPMLTCAQIMAEAPTGSDAPSFDDALATATSNAWDPETNPGASDESYPGGKYRTIEPDGDGNRHPGCSTEGLSYTPADIPGYLCAAKDYPFPDDVTEDTSKPIVILIHGNSDTPAAWEPFLHPDPDSLGFPADDEARDQLAELLPAAGYRTIAVDFRIDLVDDPGGDTGNAARNIDHGWATPIAEELIKRVMDANPGRQVSIIGFSLGATVMRDALRRLFVQYQNDEWETNVFTRVDDVIAASGGHHGVSTHDVFCGNFTTMNGTAACEFGQRNTYTQVPFHEPLNGPAYTGAGQPFGGWYETPCADGDYAFGLRNACGGHTVEYTTITMQDLPNGTQQDEFVSEHASRLYPEACASNHLTGLDDYDTSGYFLDGLLRNHFGSIRSGAGQLRIVQALTE